MSQRAGETLPATSVSGRGYEAAKGASVKAKYQAGVERTKAGWEDSRKVVLAAWMKAAKEMESGADRFGMPRPNYERYERDEEGPRQWGRDAALVVKAIAESLQQKERLRSAQKNRDMER